MAPSPRIELLAIQKKLFRRNKELIDLSIEVKEPGFERYEAAYERSVRDYERVATQEEMVDAVLGSDIIYIGDYHTCNQSQRSFLRILKAVVPKDPNCIIGLELIHKKHQQIIDDFLSNRFSETTFIKKIGLKEHWVFDLWENFKPLFDFSRYHEIPIYGIDAAHEDATLLERDEAAAQVVADIIKNNPASRLFVFIGDLHLAPQHLPGKVRKILAECGIKKKDLILYENSDSIYWKLAQRGLDDRVEVVRLPDGSFCRMHTPPIVCQQSYLNWLEHEEGEIDYADAKTSFLELLTRIAQFLRIRLKSNYDDVEVFTCGDLSFLKRLKESGKFTKKELNTIKKQILSSESYYIAKTKFVYLANLSLNHAAEEAAHYLKHLCAGLEEPRELVDAFYSNILHEALGFFGSKLINHKRKCYHEKDFRDLLTYFKTVKVPADRQIEEETSNLVLEYKEFERKGNPLQYDAIFGLKMDLFLSVTHALGYMLGDRLYYGMMERRITRPHIRRLFYDPWRRRGEPFSVYIDLVRRLRHVKIPKRM
jgi:hypothetical protein